VIYNFCKKCHSSFKLKVSSCPKCNTVLSQPDTRIYRIVICHGGKQYLKIINLAKEELKLSDVKDFETIFKAKIKSGEYFASKEDRPKSATFEDVFNLYMENYKANGKKCPVKVVSLYQYYYKNGHKNFGVDFHDKPLEEITCHDIEKFKIKLLNSRTRRNGRYAPQSVVNILSLISVIFNFAIKKGYYNGINPFIRVDKLRHNRILLEFLNRKQIGDLLLVLADYEDKTIANLIKALLFSGMRRGEIFKLKWQHIDFVSQTVKILDPKGGQDIMLPLLNSALEVFKEQRKLTGHHEYVFPDSLGRMRTSNNNVKEWYDIRVKAGINIRLHSLRHTFATSCVSSGIPLTVVQKLLGHKNFSTTLRYAHVDDPIMKKSVAEVNSFYENITKSLRLDESE